MKAVILAGGLGTRISEESHIKPKPMIEIGGFPIIWHIMKIYSHYGINEFLICCGYKGYIIKEYFANYFLHQADIKVDLEKNKLEVLNQESEPWKVSLINTGEDTLTGGRIKRAADYLDDDFLLTYGDGVCDLNVSDLISFHKSHNKLVTMTTVQPPGRFGLIKFGKDGHTVSEFIEKPDGDGGWINGGFFVVKPEAIDFIDGDMVAWENDPLMNIASKQELKAFRHSGFWQSMDTLRDKNYLEKLWNNNNAHWKVW